MAKGQPHAVHAFITGSPVELSDFGCNYIIVELTFVCAPFRGTLALSVPESVGHVYTMVFMVLVYLQTGIPNVMGLVASSMHEKYFSLMQGE